MIVIVYLLWFGWYLYSHFKGVFQEKGEWEKWKEQSGITLMGIRIMSVINSVIMKFILLFVWTRPTWGYSAKNPFLYFMQMTGWYYELIYIVPSIVLLYVVILMSNRRYDSVSRKREIMFASVVNGTCFVVDCLGCGFSLACSQ